jgi:hypothetical protein
VRVAAGQLQLLESSIYTKKEKYKLKEDKISEMANLHAK